MRLCSSSTSIVENRDPSTHLNILTTRIPRMFHPRRPKGGEALAGGMHNRCANAAPPGIGSAPIRRLRHHTGARRSPLRSWGNNALIPERAAQSFTIYQTTFWVIPLTHTVPFFRIERNSLPFGIEAFSVQRSPHPSPRRARFARGRLSRPGQRLPSDPPASEYRQNPWQQLQIVAVHSRGEAR